MMIELLSEARLVRVCVCVRAQFTIWAKSPNTACQVEHGVSNTQVTWLSLRTICRRNKTGSQSEASLKSEADAQLSSHRNILTVKLLEDIPQVWNMLEKWVGQTQE